MAAEVTAARLAAAPQAHTRRARCGGGGICRKGDKGLRNCMMRRSIPGLAGFVKAQVS
ncbi:MAG: hypothetical protein RIQ60_3664 [Pseudomonadota bacterium]|jgi:hypothetical protein